MTRAEHLAWAKARAREMLVINRPELAVASMLSDLTKHRDTMPSGDPQLLINAAVNAALAAESGDLSAVRAWIEAVT